MDQTHRQIISGLYQQMYPLLFEYARSVLLNDSQAEEAVQDTFIIACRKAADLCGSPNPRGWLVITLKNVISNTRRSQAAASRILTEYLEARRIELMLTKDQMELDVLYADLADTEEFRLLKEKALDGKSYLEMAKDRNIQVDACRKRVQRAREFLRRKITV